LDEDVVYLNSLVKSITGSKKTFKKTNNKLNKFGFGNTAHLVKNNLEGYLHSGKLLQALLQKVQNLGVQVLNNITITNLVETEKQIELQTNQPFHFTTSQLLICTNAFAKDILPDADVIPARGQVIVTSPIHNLPWKGTFHAEEGFYYFRNLGNRVLLGGARNKAFEEETTTSMTTSSFIQEALEKYLDEVILPQFKNRYTIEHRWAGIMGMGSEKSPIVKALSPRMFCAIRMSGMGVALAPMIGSQVAEMMH
jgi:glycine/D-amino acid oxidase-like deaminating enzyme